MLVGAAVRDTFVREVRSALEGDTCRVWSAYTIAGTLVDLVVERQGRVLALDLVGHPGRFGPALELERYRMLRRAGLPLLPIPWSSWVRDRQSCLDAIDEELRRGRGE